MLPFSDWENSLILQHFSEPLSYSLSLKEQILAPPLPGHRWSPCWASILSLMMMMIITIVP